MAFLRTYTWFIEPLDAYTNEVLARELSEENFYRNLLCEDERERDLWECKSSFISFLRRSQKNLHVRFRVYVREGQYGKIRLADFLDKKKKPTK
jgi:hypothetical protein